MKIRAELRDALIAGDIKLSHNVNCMLCNSRGELGILMGLGVQEKMFNPNSLNKKKIF